MKQKKISNVLNLDGCTCYLEGMWTYQYISGVEDSRNLVLAAHQETTS